MLFLVGSLDSPPAPSPLLKAPRLPFEAILTGAGLMTGTKSGQAFLAFQVFCMVCMHEVHISYGANCRM